MSIQNRSRIRGVGDYSEEFGLAGSCCLPFEPNPISSTFQECLDKGGYFQLEDANNAVCPNLGATGCCCSCQTIVDAGEMDEFLEEVFDDNIETTARGLQDNVTFCECNKRGGSWAEGVGCSTFINTDNVHAFCKDKWCGCDLRAPNACFVTTEDGDSNLITNCYNVCLPEDCSELIEQYGGLTANDESYMSLNQTCYNESLEFGTPCDCIGYLYTEDCEKEAQGFIVRTNVNVSDNNNVIVSNVDRRSGVSVYRIRNRNLEDSTNQFDEFIGRNVVHVNELSSCIHQKEDGEYICNEKTNSECDKLSGIYMGMDSKDNSNYGCDHPETEMLRYYLQTGKVKESSLKDFEIMSNFMNRGFYAGVYNVKSETYGSGSVCYGNPKTGSAFEYVSEQDQYGLNENSKNKYAVVFQMFSSMYFNNKNLSINTSQWDTHQNNNILENSLIVKSLHENSSSTVKWQLPSLDLLSWFTNEYKKNQRVAVRNIRKYNDREQMISLGGLMMKSVNNFKLNKFFWTSTIKTSGQEDLVAIQRPSDGFVGFCPINNIHSILRVWLIPVEEGL